MSSSRPDEVFLDLPARGGPDGWAGEAIWHGRSGDTWTEEPAATWSSPQG